MLRAVKKAFEIDHGVSVKPPDIVDVSGWKNADALERTGYLGITNATKATVDQNPSITSTMSPSVSAEEAGPRKKKIKRSALASRPRVFTRKA